MAWRRVKSASSDRNPNESARATSPGTGGMSRTVSVAAGALLAAAARSSPAAATASANAKTAALRRTAGVTDR